MLLGGESVIDSTVEDKLADYAHLGEEGVERLGPSRIVILGGTSAVNETVAAQLGEYLD